ETTMSAKNKEPEVTVEAVEPADQAVVVDEETIEAEGSNLTKQQVSEAEQQAITENAVNRVNQEFMDSHTPSVREEQPASEEQVAYDA
ncbi:hypothetical protein, partial [Streptococcus pneumoniae]|uniref:hypothetical protein n=1 Tax=Streptococcus pneumoniae TaxID=1313 RepID=UPI0018B0B177